MIMRVGGGAIGRRKTWSINFQSNESMRSGGVESWCGGTSSHLHVFAFIEHFRLFEVDRFKFININSMLGKQQRINNQMFEEN